MVFPSVSVYLDPPNWNQLQLEQQQEQQSHQPGRICGGGGTRFPRPEPAALNCPRCDSINTKFCYFNNYSLSQPRHFCKTCRRYWTRGGAIRNVPVGGGCRRNKRTKSSGGGSSSKSSIATADRQTSTASSSLSSAITSSVPLQQQQLLPLISSWNSLPDLPNLGLGFTGIPQIQQFPFGNLDPPPQPASLPVLYPLAGDQSSTAIDHGRSDLLGQSKQLTSVRMGDRSHHEQLGLSFPRQYLGFPSMDNLWAGSGSSSGGGWAMDLSGLNSSS